MGTRVFLFPNLRQAFAKNPALKRRGQKILSKRIREFCPTAQDFIIAPFEASPGVAGRWMRWEELTRNLEAAHDELEPIHQWTHEFSKHLSQDHHLSPHRVSIAESLETSFMLGHTEEFPFFVLGIQNFLAQNAVQEVICLVGWDHYAELFGDVAQTVGVPIRLHRAGGDSFFWKMRSIGMRWAFLSELLKTFFWILQPARQTFDLAPPLWFIKNKDRSDIYLREISIPFKKSFQTAQSHSVTIGLSRQGRQYSHLDYVSLTFSRFRRARLAFAGLRYLTQSWSGLKNFRSPTRFHQIDIQKYQHEFLKRLWFIRGTALYIGIHALAELKSRGAAPRWMFFIDPSDSAFIFSRIFKETPCRSLFYFSVYNGYPSTHSIWEKGLQRLRSIDEIVSINQWTLDRIQKVLPGFDKNRLHVVGDLFQDPKTEKDRFQMRRALGLTDDQKVVLILSRHISSHVSLDEKKALFKKTYESCQKNGWELLVKGHPFETHEQLNQELSEWGCRAKVFIREHPLHDLIQAADLIANTASGSTVVYANFLNRPAYIVSDRTTYDILDRLDGPYAYRKYGGAVCFELEESIDARLVELMDSPTARSDQIAKGRSFAERFSGTLDGKSALRICERLQNLVKLTDK